MHVDDEWLISVQGELEGISEQLRIPGSKALGPVMSSVRRSHSILKNDQAKIVSNFAPDKKVPGGRVPAPDAEASCQDTACSHRHGLQPHVPVCASRACH